MNITQGFFRIFLISVLGNLGAMAATGTRPGEYVLYQEGHVYHARDGATVSLEDELSFPHEIRIFTNGTFRVKEGKARAFAEGQILGADGMLISPDGTIVPVMDHVLIKDGRARLVRDGEASLLGQPLVLDDGTRIAPDRRITTPNGNRYFLLDGQLYQLNGRTLPVLDSVTLLDGSVVLQKDGSRLSLQPRQIMMMSDGTKVFGNGTIRKNDGEWIALSPGEIFPVEGVVVQRK